MPLALVTGSTRRLGGHIAARLAESGWAVALHGSDSGEPEPWLAEQLDAAANEWHGFAADLASDDAPTALMRDVTRHFDMPVALLVNNASLFAPSESGTPDVAALVEHFRINSAAPFALAALVAGQGQDASVVHILDQRIRHPHGDQQAYTLSKMALSEAVRLQARTFAPRVRVNGVAPGLTLPTGEYGEDKMERLAAMMPLECLPSPDDIADAVLYLAGAKAVTGQALFVDGGASMISYDHDFFRLVE
ncbi:SDR family oxidoreductase [Stakelama sediminis]|uniref:NAD(P)-dependent dehydrogenase (Short-subunit alcohol dehydrogenase family) n=1 Tax=Stakelama sediminis TaxID=463200 RepID=A0A840YZP8_9SPHN|nr:NAD(P)-dependent dehydrogenase (short-subunit alcohol dehydrogenase family) [Stakelama sediminis]